MRPRSRTSFHHQPEAQHPKSSAIHKLPADYPIFRTDSDQKALMPTNSPTTSGRPLSRCCRTNRAVSRANDRRVLNGIFWGLAIWGTVARFATGASAPKPPATTVTPPSVKPPPHCPARSPRQDQANDRNAQRADRHGTASLEASHPDAPRDSLRSVLIGGRPYQPPLRSSPPPSVRRAQCKTRRGEPAGHI